MNEWDKLDAQFAGGQAPAAKGDAWDQLDADFIRPAGKAAAAPAQAPRAPAAPADRSYVGSAAAAAGAGFGKTVLGLQRLAGKGLEAVGADRAGGWLVRDADAGKAKLDAELAPYKDANPLTAGAGEVGGQIAATLPLGMLRVAQGGAKVAGMLPRIGQAARVGAVYGGVQGATGSSADTFGGMVGDGALSAGISATMGGVATPVIGALGAVGSNIRQRVSNSSAGQHAKLKVAEALARDARGSLATGGAVNPLGQVAARFGKLGDEAVVADAAGRNTIQLLDTLATLPGRTKEAAANLLHRRQATSGARLRGAADDALGTQGHRLAGTIDDLIATRKEAAAPLYDIVRQTELTPTDNLASIVASAHKLGATRTARQIATARQEPFTLDVGNTGSPWRLQNLDHVKQGLDDLIEANKNEFGKLTPKGAAFHDLKTKLVNELDAMTTSPQTGQSFYKAARDAYAGPSAMISAAQKGRMAIHGDEAAIGREMAGLSAAELDSFKIGVYEGLRHKLGTQGGQTEVMNMWKNPTMQERLRVLFGDERSFRKFAADAARENTLKRLQSVDSNSKTAARLAGMGDLDAAALGDAGAALGAAKTGNILSAIGSAKNAWNRVATPQTVRDEMGQMLLSRGAEGQRQLQSIGPLIDQINRRNMLLSNGVGVLSSPLGSGVILPASQLPRKQ